jgi:hypothetical protein
MLDDIKNIKSSQGDLRKFGLTLGVFFLLIGLLWFWKARHGYIYFFSLAVFFLVFAFLAPRLLKPIQKIWMIVALLMGWVMTRVILSVVFYFVMTPIGFIARLMGKKFLDVKNHNGYESYWLIRKSLARNKEDHEKQY